MLGEVTAACFQTFSLAGSLVADIGIKTLMLKLATATPACLSNA